MGSSFCHWHQMGGIGMDGANKNVGAEGLLKILRCGLERSAEQRTAIQLGDRSQYVGMSDIAKMLDCPRADRKSTRLNSSHPTTSRMPSSA